MTINPTIDLGSIVTLIGFVVAGLAFVFSLRGDIKLLSSRIATLESIGKDQSTILIRLASQDTRLLSHEGRLGRIENQLDNQLD